MEIKAAARRPACPYCKAPVVIPTVAVDGEGFMPRYFVALHFGPDYRIEITAEEHETILNAVEALIHSVEAEENFRSVIENYADFERVIFNRSLRVDWRSTRH